MRIAVLVYGRLHRCVEHYTNIVESIGRQNDIDFFLSSDNSSESLLHDFLRIYRPIVYTNSPIHYDYNLANYPGKPPETNIHSMTCHFINKNRVFVLFEEYAHREHIQYDCVISLRVDLAFQTGFVLNALEENTIYIPHGSDWGGINDQVAYGNVDVMKTYNSINAIDLLEKQCSIPHPERLYKAHIDSHMLRVVRVPIQYRIDK